MTYLFVIPGIIMTLSPVMGGNSIFTNVGRRLFVRTFLNMTVVIRDLGKEPPALSSLAIAAALLLKHDV